MAIRSHTEESPTPRRRLRLKTKLLLVLALLAALAVSFLLGSILAGRDSPPAITSQLLGQQLANIQELSTVEYHYTNMGKFEHQVDFYGWKVPFTTKSFIVSYDGIIKAGIDLSALQMEVTADRITVTLPDAQILSHQMDENSLEIFDETKNVFNAIQISDYTGFTSDQKASIETKAIENGLLTAAADRAAASVRQLISTLPSAQEYTVIVTGAN